MSIVEKNSEILFLYDAKLCNPNGDPDDENRPRMDYDQERCLVSDVRLKRYLRDYLEEMGHTIYVTKSAGVVQAGNRLMDVLDKEKVSGNDLPELLAKLLDDGYLALPCPSKGNVAVKARPSTSQGQSNLPGLFPQQGTTCGFFDNILTFRLSIPPHRYLRQRLPPILCPDRFPWYCQRQACPGYV